MGSKGSKLPVECCDVGMVSTDNMEVTNVLPDEQIMDYALNVFDCDAGQMCGLYLRMIQKLDLQDTFNIADDTVTSFAREVGKRYRNNPYHNFKHGFSITQFLYVSCSTSDTISNLLVPNDVLAMLVASLVHDVDHPGNNNDWEVKNKTELAVRYNDVAVLENHHVAIGRQILQNTAFDLFGTLKSVDAKADAYETYTHAILQTDMAQHFPMVDKLKELPAGASEAFDKSTIKDRRNLVGVLTHSADISNPLIPKFSVCRKWAEQITAEFILQYKQEKQAGLPETKMWANVHTPLGFYKSQVGFIDFLVMPLWTRIFELFPELKSRGKLEDSINANKAEWQALASKEEASS